MEPLSIIKKYYLGSSDAHRILVTHSRSVADKVLTLTRLYPEMNLDPTFVEEATMLHDIGIFLCNTLDIDCRGEAGCICYGYLGADLTRREGYPRHALVYERRMGVRLSFAMIEKRNLPVPRRDMCFISLEEQLICFADKLFSRTKLTKEKPANKIEQSLSKYENETVEQFERWCKLLLGK